MSAPVSYFLADPTTLVFCGTCNLDYDPSPEGFHTAGCSGCDPDCQPRKPSSAPMLTMTEEEFLAACTARLETLYRQNNMAYDEQGKLEPFTCFRIAPRLLNAEVSKALDAFGNTWEGSEFK